MGESIALAHSLKRMENQTLWKICNILLLRLCLGLLSIMIVTCSKNPEENEHHVSDFSLEDLNPNSPTYRQLIGPWSYDDQVSAFYFGDQG